MAPVTGREPQQFTIAQPEVARDEGTAFSRHAAEVFRRAPVQAVVARGVAHVLRRHILHHRSRTPHAPEFSIMIQEIVVQLKLPRLIVGADDRMLTLQQRQRSIVDPGGISSRAGKVEHRGQLLGAEDPAEQEHQKRSEGTRNHGAAGAGSLQDCQARKRHAPSSNRQTARKARVGSMGPVSNSMLNLARPDMSAIPGAGKVKFRSS